MKRWLIAAGVLAATVTVPLAVLAQDSPVPDQATTPQNPGSTGISRVEKTVLTSFEHFAAPTDTNRDNKRSVVVEKATIVIETWSAGN